MKCVQQKGSILVALMVTLSLVTLILFSLSTSMSYHTTIVHERITTQKRFWHMQGLLKYGVGLVKNNFASLYGKLKNMDIVVPCEYWVNDQHMAGQLIFSADKVGVRVRARAIQGTNVMTSLSCVVQKQIVDEKEQFFVMQWNIDTPTKA